MSDKATKAKKWSHAVRHLRRMNSERLQARWYSIYITKPAFRTKKRRNEFKEIESILRERNIKPQKPKAFT